MKKYFTYCLVLLFVFIMLTACGDSNTEKDEGKARGERVVTQEATQPPSETPTPTFTPTPTVSLSRDVENEEMSLKIYGWDCKGIFTGHLNENGLPDGYATYSINEPVGSYKGYFKNGLLNGRGILCLTVDGQYYVLDGEFDEDIFVPSFAERYNSMGQSGMTYFGTFSVSLKQLLFINDNESLFVNASDEKLKQMPLKEFSAKGFKKSREQDEIGLIKLQLTASQAFEDRVDDFWGYKGYITEVLAYDKGLENYYTITLFGRTDVCEGDSFEVYALPIATSSFDNVGGGKTNVIVLLACSMK